MISGYNVAALKNIIDVYITSLGLGTTNSSVTLHMLQKTYSIYAEDLNDVQLFAEAGKNHIACWCKKPGEKTLKAFEFFLCDDYTSENFEELLDNTRLHSRLLTMPVSNTVFFWNTSEALCLPEGKEDADFFKSKFLFNVWHIC